MPFIRFNVPRRYEHLPPTALAITNCSTVNRSCPRLSLAAVNEAPNPEDHNLQSRQNSAHAPTSLRPVHTHLPDLRMFSNENGLPGPSGLALSTVAVDEFCAVAAVLAETTLTWEVASRYN